MTIAAHRPRFTEAEAEILAQRFYGLTATARPLPSERDQNFHLQSETGEFVLKISSANEESAILDLQNRAIEHLAKRKVPVPQIHRTPAEEWITAVNSPGGVTHFVRLLTYLPGVPLATVKPHSPALLHSFGQFLGRIDAALLDFSHPSAHRDLQWDLANATTVINRHKNHITTPDRHTLIDHFLELFEQEVTPRLGSLRMSIIHNDANNHNVLVNESTLLGREVVGLIDFGDILHSYTIADLAIALAYVMLDKADPLTAAAHVVRGYHQLLPLTEVELTVLYPLIGLRLCTSVTLSAYQQQQEPDNPYLSISETSAWVLLEQLQALDPHLAHYTFRHACGLAPNPTADKITTWLTDHQNDFGPVVDLDLKNGTPLVFDLSVDSPDLGNLATVADTRAFTDRLFDQMKVAGAEVGLGRYNEARPFYSGDLFAVPTDEFPERRTIHLGVDIFLPPGTPVLAPLDGLIHSFQNNSAHHDYGPTIILEHTVDHLTFYTLYGHLSEESLAGLRVGQPVQQGASLATIGDFPANGDWPPHLHFQIITDLLGRSGEFPGVVAPSQQAVWLNLCPDPNLILGLPALAPAPEPMSQAELLAIRRTHLGPSLSIAYQKPLHIVRGWRQYLYDETGQAYLDGVNNVCHVGHSHPRVVEAATRQMALLNTNTRYLHENLVRYAERLAATLPDPLEVCFFVCSGSEANELALRLARTHTGQQDMIVVDGAYHGHTTALIDISPYKHNGPGGQGAPPHVHPVEMPDGYRGQYKGLAAATGQNYAAQVQAAIEQVQKQDRGIAGFIAESILSCGGQIVLPDGYLAAVYDHVRAAGGVCIADEVQVGFGRVGSHFWAFETQGVVPDIVTLGKPIGNGHPLAAVVTTREIAESFANGMEYFNTFGGNPVSCAVGLAVLDVIEQEQLQAHALRVGERLKAGLAGLMDEHPLIGDVRGLGLFLGFELVRDRETLEPAADEATYIANRMRDHGLLISTDGPLHNVLKLKPPLVFSEANADLLVATLDKILGEDCLGSGGGQT